LESHVQLDNNTGERGNLFGWTKTLSTM